MKYMFILNKEKIINVIFFFKKWFFGVLVILILNLIGNN